MNPKTLEKFHRTINKLFEIELRLNRYAQALEVVGNDKLATSLDYMAGEVAVCHELISQAVGETVGDLVKDSNASTNNMIEAILVMQLREPQRRKGSD